METARRPDSKSSRATIIDVARHAFVSTTTVSHAINGTRFVSDDTRERVLRVAAELGYRPNAAARSLTTKRTGVVGVVVPHLDNNHVAELLRGLHDVLVPALYSTLVCDTDREPPRESHYVDILLSQRVEGIVSLITTESWTELIQAENLRLPIVFVDRPVSGRPVPFVGIHNRQAVALGVRHLLDAGHRQIGMVAGPSDRYSPRERLLAFRETLREHGLTVPAEWEMPCSWTTEGGREATRRLLTLARRPTAIFVNSSTLSLGALRTIHELGLRCPDDVAVVAVDNDPWSEVSDPPLTVLRVPSRQMGRTAARMLLTLMAGDELAETHVLHECELILRRSCCRHHDDGIKQ